MSVPTVSWDETTPAGSDDRSQGDDRIRELKTQLREVIGVDHDFPSSGQDAGNGQHLQVTFQETADLGTGATGVPILGAQTDSGGSGAPELCYVTEGDTNLYLTDGTRIGNRNENLIASTVDATGLFINGVSIIEMFYPVGSIYCNASVSTNPGTLLGFGTWTAFGAGRVMVGLDSGDTDFDTAEETGGSKTHTLTVDEIPAHTHTIEMDNGGSVSSDRALGRSGSALSDQTSGSTGGGSAHTIVQPYIVVYMWKRAS